MSDFIYNWVVRICGPAFTVSSSPVVLHRERAAEPGAYILAPNHLSAYDVPCLMKESPRNLDFVSITELYQNRMVAAFFTSVNVFPLDRSRPDSPTVRIILERLRRGRAVVMVPEGRIRSAAESVLNGGEIKPGVARIAQMAGVPVVPCVLLDTGAYARPSAWLPVRGTRFGVAFGRPLHVPGGLDEAESRAALLAAIKRSYRELHVELLAAMRETGQTLWQRLTQNTRRHVAAGTEGHG
jgi:1-acyl-sn-glycerol-3-phosphate acyltransferase